jgi:two-component system, chemotaxis family, chemotaxis protein CheY
VTRILVMDDDDTFRHALRVTLEGAGYAVAEAPDGVAGLRLYHQLGADLVLVDIFMPEMDGFEVIRALRTQVPLPPIVAMSGGGPTRLGDVLAIAATLGATRTLRKPFTPRELVDALRDVLGEAS